MNRLKSKMKRPAILISLTLVVAACAGLPPTGQVHNPTDTELLSARESVPATSRLATRTPHPSQTATSLPLQTSTSRPSPSAAPATIPPTPDTIFPDNLVAYYTFEGDGDDRSGNGNHAEVRGATLIADRFGNPDGAYQFDGFGSYMEVKDSKSLDLTFEMSISVWLYFVPQEKQTFYTLLEKSDPDRGGHSRWGLWLIGDRAEVCIQPADLNHPQSCLDSVSPLRPETWHHLVGTYDGQTLRIYLDGKPDAEREFPASAIAQNNFPLYLGTDLFNSEILFTRGVIDEIRIYKRTLTPAEILQLFEHEK